MPPQFWAGNMGGLTRVRTARPGYDASDPGLDRRFLSFDSQWLNSFRLVDNGIIPTSSMTDNIMDDGGGGARAGGIGASMAVTYHAPSVSIGAGASVEAVAELRRALDDDRRQFASKTIRTIQDARQRNWQG